MQQNEIVDRIESRGDFESESAALDAAQATLRTLGERISAGQAEDIAEQLPDELAGPVLTAGGEAEAFSPSTFVGRVSHREDADGETESHVRAVLRTVGDALEKDQWDAVTGQLPPEYRPLCQATDRGIDA